MREYSVRIPIAGYAQFSVEATSEKEAIAKGVELLEVGFQPGYEWMDNFKDGEKKISVDMCELLVVEKIVQGNFSHVDVLEADAERCDDYDNDDEDEADEDDE